MDHLAALTGVGSTSSSGTRWRTFCNCLRAFLEPLTAIFEESSLVSDVEEQPPSSTERFLYGSDTDGDSDDDQRPVETQLTVVLVTADPIARAVLSIAARADVTPPIRLALSISKEIGQTGSCVLGSE